MITIKSSHQSLPLLGAPASGAAKGAPGGVAFQPKSKAVPNATNGKPPTNGTPSKLKGCGATPVAKLVYPGSKQSHQPWPAPTVDKFATAFNAINTLQPAPSKADSFLAAFDAPPFSKDQKACLPQTATTHPAQDATPARAVPQHVPAYKHTDRHTRIEAKIDPGQNKQAANPDLATAPALPHRDIRNAHILYHGTPIAPRMIFWPGGRLLSPLAAIQERQVVIHGQQTRIRHLSIQTLANHTYRGHYYASATRNRMVAEEFAKRASRSSRYVYVIDPQPHGRDVNGVLASQGLLNTFFAEQEIAVPSGIATADIRGAYDLITYQFVRNPYYEATPLTDADAGQQRAVPTLRLAGMMKTGGPLGTMPGGVYRDAQGLAWYVKQSPSEDHARNEILAGYLYRAAGTPTLRHELIDMGAGRLGLASPWEPRTDFERHQPDHVALAQDHLAAHMWLANWDAVGADFDNQAVMQGRMTTIDSGGALLFRAQGEPKTSCFGRDARADLAVFTDMERNPQAGRIFAAMPAHEVVASLEKVTSISDHTIRALVGTHGPGIEPQRAFLAGLLIARRDSLHDFSSTVAKQKCLARAIKLTG